MEDAIIEKAIDLAFEPEGFKDLTNLSDNILAYSIGFHGENLSYSSLEPLKGS